MEGARRVPRYRHHFDLSWRLPVVKAVLEREKPEFAQIDYSIDDRETEKRILPFAAEVKVGRTHCAPLWPRTAIPRRSRPALPDWAQSFAGSWAQFFLNIFWPIHAVIPGTADAAHMADNLRPMRGALPDSDQRQRMVQFVDSL